MNPRIPLTSQTLRELFAYDPDSGIFTRRADGLVMGNAHSQGYLSFYIGGTVHKRYLVHRLAWLYMTGEWPAAFIDHRNMDKTDNRWANLRCSTKSQNAANTGVASTNTSGFKGVTAHRKGRWNAAIQHNGKKKSLGVYDCKAAAHFAYIVGADKTFGEFARAI